MIRNKSYFIAALIFLLSSVCTMTAAHFLLNINVRVMHVEHFDHGLRVYLRLPLVFAVVKPTSDSPASANQTKLANSATPYTKDVEEQGQLMHYLDVDALKKNPNGLAELVLAGHHITVNGVEKIGSISETRVYPASQQPAFASLNEAKQAFSENPVYPANEAPSYIGDTIIDVLIQYEFAEQIIQYKVTSSLKPGLPGQEQMSNLIFDHANDETLTFQQTGLLEKPITVTRNAWRSVATFIKLGIHHISTGMDHLLFIFCLTLGAMKFSTLAWRITAFTVGHMVTLIIGVLGYTPTAAWFVPAVETAIALSIIYVGYLALVQRAERSSLLLVAALGLLHGLGFSFVMQEVLQVNVPNLWASLLSFNLGIEIGQLVVIACIWPLLMLLSNYNNSLFLNIKRLLIFASIGVACLWVSERVLLFPENIW